MFVQTFQKADAKTELEMQQNFWRWGAPVREKGSEPEEARRAVRLQSRSDTVKERERKRWNVGYESLRCSTVLRGIQPG